MFCLTTALLNCRKNIGINLITATTIAITLIIFISFLLVVLNLSVLKKNWTDKLQIIIYLKDNITTSSIENTKSYVSNLKEVDFVKFVSRDAALNMLKTSLKGQDGILEGLEENPLPSSLEIKLNNNFLTADCVEQFAAKVQKIKSVADVEYGQKWLRKFITFFDALKLIGFCLTGLLFLFTLFIISNTINLMVLSRRNEISVMKLFGATNRFIKLPFFIEAVIQGVAGASIALLFLSLAINFFLDNFISSLHFYFGSGNLVFLDTTLAFFILLLGAGLGFTGSLISLNSLDEFKK